MANGTWAQLVLPNEIRLIDLTHTVSESMAGLAGLDEDDALNVGLAVREAVINAMVHGNRQRADRSVTVRFDVAAGELRVRVRDEGDGFDPASAADPTAHENLLRTSGRGLLLMRAFVDEMSFSSAGGGTEVTLVKRSSSAHGPGEETAASNGGIEE
jgi:serine/threonine-protein kinase RsbW